MLNPKLETEKFNIKKIWRKYLIEDKIIIEKRMNEFKW